MLALICGLTAACAWAVHDLLVRKIGQEAQILPMMLAVVAAGTVALVLPTALIAEWQLMTGPAYGFSAAAGLAYVLGMGGLYRAFSLAPVRIVAPILGSFPMISLGFAAIGGKAVSGIELAAVLAIVGGIAIVALAGRSSQRWRTGTRTVAGVPDSSGLTGWLRAAAPGESGATPATARPWWTPAARHPASWPHPS